MPAPKGNNYWEFRNKHGRNHEYTPDALWEEALKYFQWTVDNPLWEAVVVTRGIKIKDENGDEKIVHTTNVPKMRAMTIAAFCLFADICEKTFANYRNNKDFVQVIYAIERTIYTYKFEGAAATLLNPNIIARDLGLAERKEIDLSGRKKSVNDLFPSVDELLNEDEVDEQEDKS